MTAPARTTRGADTLQRLLLAGLGLGLCEVALALATRGGLFLSLTEASRYARLALPAAASATLIVGFAGRALLRALGERPRNVVAGVALAIAPALCWALWLTTEGRRVRDLAGRLPLVIFLGLAGALAVGWLAHLFSRAGPAERGRYRLGLGAFVVLALCLDAFVLPRLYPAAHWALAASAVVATAAFAGVWTPPRRLLLSRRAGVLASCLMVPWAALEALSVRDAPNARFAIEQAAPLTAKLLSLWPRSRSARPSPAPEAPSPEVERATRGLDLRGADVLLISIDALRADRVASGEGGPTPALDRLARESVVFDRAYTPTPHTSYALASTLTGKYLRPLMELSGELSEQPTLPRLLRRHAYRTAAFYPPAVFFVDEHRFRHLAEERFGFEYTKAMFASAALRVKQLEAYLAAAAPDHPLFVWVHLFEPHEPYDPPEEFARGDSPRERYEGEVACADDAAGKLVAAFRRARPGATIIVTADHGEEFGDHGGSHHGTTLFDEQVRVPLLWSSPGVVPRRVSAPVETVDIVTTLLSALGIPRDVRMRGDDLTPILSGAEAPASLRAFASLKEQGMVTDGRMKAICDRFGEDCRLFDLVADPAERRDVSRERPEALASLRRDLSDFYASIPRVEALSMDGGGGWPEALARARLGDASAAGELMALLGSSRPQVRRAAARALGELGHAPARAALARLREADADAGTRLEAAIAGLSLGDASAAAPLRETVMAEHGADADEARQEALRRAALSLASAGHAEGRPVLLSLLADAAAAESARVAALAALSRVGRPADVAEVAALLDDVRLRPHVARTLGHLGADAAEPLAQALAVERYPEAREAEARALLALGDRRAPALIVRHLGTASSLPEGLALLEEVGQLAGHGGVLARRSALRAGAWECADDAGCAPGDAAALRLPSSAATKGPSRLVVRVRAELGARLTLADTSFELRPGDSQVSMALPAAAGVREVPVRAQRTRLWSVALVPERDEIPPPPPEPWGPDAGIAEGGE